MGGQASRLDGERLGVEMGLDGGGLQELRGGGTGGAGRSDTSPLGGGSSLVLDDVLLRLLLDQRVRLDVGIGCRDGERHRERESDMDTLRFTLI